MTQSANGLTEAEFAAFRGFDEAMAEYERDNPPPKCHFRYMEAMASDYEEWFECEVCGHTKEHYVRPGER